MHSSLGQPRNKIALADGSQSEKLELRLTHKLHNQQNYVSSET